MKGYHIAATVLFVAILIGTPAFGETVSSSEARKCGEGKECTIDDALSVIRGGVSEQEAAFQEDSGEEDYSIADPVYPWNVVMYHFNDSLYFWLMKPISQGYRVVIPGDFRVLMGNAYDNIASPIRIFNNLFQLRFDRAFTGLIRFVVNSTLGVGGLRDCAKDCFGMERNGEDFGRTLGHWGVGHGFYIVWPVFGPSSFRDTFGFAGDRIMNPLFYADPTLLAIGFSAHSKVNDLSFHIGDYEALKEAAIDPYVSMRNGYIQFRKRTYHR